jgi:hypothetical protein
MNHAKKHHSAQRYLLVQQLAWFNIWRCCGTYILGAQEMCAGGLRLSPACSGQLQGHSIDVVLLRHVPLQASMSCRILSLTPPAGEHEEWLLATSACEVSKTLLVTHIFPLQVQRERKHVVDQGLQRLLPSEASSRCTAVPSWHGFRQTLRAAVTALGTASTNGTSANMHGYIILNKGVDNAL